MLFIRQKILRPFEQLTDVPYQLSKGNLTVPIKENKSRVAFGAGLLSLGLYGCVKLIDKGVKNVM